MKILILSLLSVAMSLTALSQGTNAIPKSQPVPVDTTHYTYDTLKVQCLYVNNLNSVLNNGQLGLVLRISKFKDAYVVKDSTTLKKEKVEVERTYYVPVITQLPVNPKKSNMKPKNQLTYQQVPSELILMDFNRNFDNLIKAANQANANQPNNK